MLIVFIGVSILVEELFSIKAPSALGTVIACVSIAWVSRSFGEKNGRYFSKSEKRAVVFGCLGISILVQVFIAAIVILVFLPAGTISHFATLFANLFNMGNMIYIFISIMAMIIASNIAGAYLFIFLTKKQLIRDKIIQPE